MPAIELEQPLSEIHALARLLARAGETMDDDGAAVIVAADRIAELVAALRGQIEPRAA